MTRIGEERAFTALDRYIEKKMELGSIPGLAVGITDSEHLLGCRYYGFADVAAGTVPGPDTLFEIGSISKSFASIVALQLVEEGLLDLRLPVDEYLPWLEMKWKREKFSMHHLMSHTAGLPIGQEETPEAISEVWAAMGMELGCSPGEHFHYSNIGYKIVGLVIEEVTGRSCADEVKARVFGPLGMGKSHAAITADLRESLATGYEPFPDDRPVRRGIGMVPAPWWEGDSADGSICSTPEDMSAYVRMLLDLGAHPGGRLLSDASFRDLTRPVIRPDDSEGEHYAYGLRVESVDAHRFVAHTGGMVGYISAMRMDLASGIGVIVLTNGATEVDDVARYALKAFSAASSEDGDVPPELPYSLGAEPAEMYAGVYGLGQGSLIVAPDGSGGLIVTYGGRSGALLSHGKDVFLAELPGFDMFLLRFSREDGRVIMVSYGDRVYRRDKAETSEDATVPDLVQPFIGHFRSSNPWLTNFRVLYRNGSLWLVPPTGDEQELVSLGENEFRIGSDERSPERLTFEATVNGKAQRADMSGQSYARTRGP